MGEKNVLVAVKNGDLTFSGRGFTPTGYNPPIQLKYETWAEDGELVQALDRANKWIAGDYFNEGNDRFGEQAAQIIGDEYAWGFGPEKIKKLAWVARQVAPEQRRADSSWSHHMLVAPLSADEQTEWLEFAALGKLTVAALREALITAGAITPRAPKVAPALEMAPVEYLIPEPEPEVTEEEPDYPTIPLMAEDLLGGNGGGGLPSQSQNGNGFGSNGRADWDRDDYVQQEDDAEVKVIKDSPRKSARILYNILGEKWCAALIAELVALAPEEETYIDA